MVQWVMTPLQKPASHLSVQVLIQAVPLEIYLCIYMPRREADNNPSTWVPANHVGEWDAMKGHLGIFVGITADSYVTLSSRDITVILTLESARGHEILFHLFVLLQLVLSKLYSFQSTKLSLL